MATVYSKTDNYGLNLYGDNDPADLRDGYNGSMRTIDDTLEKHLDRIEGVESRETHDEEVVKALIGDNTVDSATAAKNKWDKAGTDATAATAAADAAASKADNNSGILSALGADSAANAAALKTKWDNAAQKSDSQEPRVQALESKVQVLEHGGVKNIVLLGDSWTESQNYALYRYLQADTPSAVWHNYGVSGALVQELPQQVASAKNDQSLKPEEVTDVVIVAGTNNVFWTNLHDLNDITQDDAYRAFLTVRNYFSKARIMFFPDNSKTLNDGRNGLYVHMIKGALSAGVETHAESLNLLCGHLDWFYGDDQGGVQHLSDPGYHKFANSIANVIHGGTMYADGLMISKDLQHTNPSSMEEVDDNTIQIYGVSKGVHPVGYLSSPKARFCYYSDQTVDIDISGTFKLNQTEADKYNSFVLGCPNWYKRIAVNTLPYVFFGTVFYESIVDFWIDDAFGKTGIMPINGATQANVCFNDFYLPLLGETKTYGNKPTRIVIKRAPTMLTGNVDY